MKRILMLLFVVITAISANAQYRKGQTLVCTGNNVNMRVGPGKNYPVGYACSGEYYNNQLHVYGGKGIEKIQLFKPDYCERNGFESHIIYLGKKQNGFIYVYEEYESENPGGICGWVAAQYFRAACSRCEGDGSCWRDGRSQVCPKCHGRGY